MTTHPIILVATLCSIAAVSIRSAPVCAGQKLSSIVDDSVLNLKTESRNKLIHQKSINNFVDPYILRQIFSHPGVDRQASRVCQLWEKLLTEQGTSAVVYFKDKKDLLHHPLSHYPKSRFKISCPLTSKNLAEFVQRVGAIRENDYSINLAKIL